MSQCEIEGESWGFEVIEEENVTVAVSYKLGKYPSKLDWSLLGHV